MKKMIAIAFVAVFGMSCQIILDNELCETDFSSVTTGLIAKRNNKVSLIRSQDNLIASLNNQFNFMAKQETPDQKKMKELQQKYKTAVDEKNKMSDDLFVIGLKLDVALKTEKVSGPCPDKKDE